MTAFRLRLTSRSDNAHDSVVVWLGGREAAERSAPPVIWSVIRRLGYRSFHIVDYPAETAVRAQWDFGASGAELVVPAEEGSFELTEDGNAFALRLVTPGAAGTIQVTNRVRTPGGVKFSVLKSGKIAMQQPPLGCGQSAAFAFPPLLGVALLRDAVEGTALPAYAATQPLIEIPLDERDHADVVLRGDLHRGYSFTEEIASPSW